MKQTFRLNVFETNSSSMHTITLVTPEQFQMLRQEELYYNNGNLVTKEDIINSFLFKSQQPNYENASDEDKALMFKEFMEENCDGDYSEYYTFNHVDETYIDCYNENGEPVIAVSFYIPG